MSLNKTPFFELRSGSVDTLLFVVKTPDLDALRTELTRRFEATPEFFAGETVAIDVRRLAGDEHVPLDALAQLLDSVRMRPVGVVALGWPAPEEEVPGRPRRPQSTCRTCARCEPSCSGDRGSTRGSRPRSVGRRPAWP